MNLLMLSGDSTVATGEDGAFHQMLRRFRAYWERIDVLCPAAPTAAPRSIDENVFVHPSPWHKALQPLFIRNKALTLMAQRPYHLIVSHDFGFFYNGVGARLLNQPYVSEIHHIEGYPHAVTRREQVARRAAAAYVRWAARRVLAFRAVNTDEVPQFLGRCGVPAEKIRVLPSLYIDFDVFAPQPAAPKRFDVVFVGRFAPNKGLFTLLDAFAQVKRTHPAATMALLGRGELQRQIEKVIERYSLRDSVTLITERVPLARVAEFYNQARMLVCASTSEGGPRVTVEAMACGVPVISTPVGMMRELIRDGENGLRFEWDADQLAGHIRRLLDDADLRARLGEAGRHSVQGFTADAVIARYAQGYLDLIRQHSMVHV